MTVDISTMNTEQKQAVLHNDGACLVLAGAGSGKTAVLTKRAARLIKEGVSPERILLATFTKKAAGEMKDRLAALVGEEALTGAWIGTFHSLCLRMLKISYHELGLPPFEVLPPHKAMRIARDILGKRDEKHPYGMDWQQIPKHVLSRVSRAKADLYSVENAEKYFREHMMGDQEGILRHVQFWQAYEAIKAAATPRQFDFDDFLLEMHRLLATNPDALARWQGQFDYVMEDEVQDTMMAQHAIVQLLCREHENYFAVGDPQQSVYGFRGSDPEKTVMAFLSDYEGGTVIKLRVNYRSQSRIVEHANALIARNNLDPTYAINPTSHRGAGDPPHLLVTFNETNEAEQAADLIVEKCLEGRSYRDIALLYRTNAQARSFEDVFVQRSIPYVVHGSAGFYDRREVKDLLAFLQLAHDPQCEAANEALERIINIPTKWYKSRGQIAHTHYLGAAFLREVKTIAVREEMSYYDALEEGGWSGWQWDAIRDFRQYIDIIRSCAPDPRAMLVAAREMGYDLHLAREEGTDTEESENDGTRGENLDSLVYAAAKYDNPAAFLDFVTQQRSKAKELAAHQDAVQLLTCHRSKGLEWPVVIVAGVAMNLLPHRRSCEYEDPETKRRLIPESIFEERRLAYVAVTRARDELYVSALQTYQDNDLKESPFIEELGLSFVEEPTDLVLEAQ